MQKTARRAITAIVAMMLLLAGTAMAADIIADIDNAIADYEDQQEKAHEAADIIRSLGYGEDSEMIKTLQGHWWSAQRGIEALKADKAELEEQSESPYTGLDISESDKIMIAKVIWQEARGEPYEGQKAVAEVILNRVLYGYWGDSVTDVVYARNQFSKPGSSYTEEQIRAVEDVLRGELALGNTEVMYFRTGRYHSGRTAYIQIGAHYFSY